MKTIHKLSLDIQIEEHRKWWAEVAKENGWYTQPFFIQVWVDAEGEVEDSVSYKGLDQDWVLDY
ncbi:hypothetical protein KDA00_05455 [Candidatus Saccharibacteria bacterium]|nr:hypothetical protein [Candidatus Saccharibacteria bacterium]